MEPFFQKKDEVIPQSGNSRVALNGKVVYKMSCNEQEVLSRKEAAKLLDLCLADFDRVKQNIPRIEYYRGQRKERYSRTDLMKYIEQCKQEPICHQSLKRERVHRVTGMTSQFRGIGLEEARKQAISQRQKE